jgi:hypothetical protein
MTETEATIDHAQTDSDESGSAVHEKIGNCDFGRIYTDFPRANFDGSNRIAHSERFDKRRYHNNHRPDPDDNRFRISISLAPSLGHNPRNSRADNIFASAPQKETRRTKLVFFFLFLAVKQV